MRIAVTGRFGQIAQPLVERGPNSKHGSADAGTAGDEPGADRPISQMFSAHCDRKLWLCRGLHRCRSRRE